MNPLVVFAGPCQARPTRSSFKRRFCGEFQKIPKPFSRKTYLKASKQSGRSSVILPHQRILKSLVFLKFRHRPIRLSLSVVCGARVLRQASLGAASQEIKVSAVGKDVRIRMPSVSPSSCRDVEVNCLPPSQQESRADACPNPQVSKPSPHTPEAEARTVDFGASQQAHDVEGRAPQARGARA